jgi:hypothetical protein
MGRMKEFDLRIRQGGDDAIAAVSELLPRWIPVSERLPQRGEKVLAFDPMMPIIQSARLTNEDWECEGLDFLKPTHWMPLPEPPEAT